MRWPFGWKYYIYCKRTYLSNSETFISYLTDFTYFSQINIYAQFWHYEKRSINYYYSLGEVKEILNIIEGKSEESPSKNESFVKKTYHIGKKLYWKGIF